jgi:hypothetical protein
MLLVIEKTASVSEDIVETIKRTDKMFNNTLRLDGIPRE